MKMKLILLILGSSPNETVDLSIIGGCWLTARLCHGVEKFSVHYKTFINFKKYKERRNRIKSKF